MSVWTNIRRHRAGNIAIVFVMAQVLCILYSLFDANFRYLSETNIQSLLLTIPPMALLAIGVGMLMIAGEFDLSVGSTFALAAYVMASSFNNGLSPWLAALASLALGGLIGVINGVIVVRVRMPSFIATLGTMMILRSVIYIFSNGAYASFRPVGAFHELFAFNKGAFQIQFLWLIVGVSAAWLVMDRHKFGNHIYATGGNRQSAFAIGVNPDRVKMICFIIVGVLAAFASLLSTVRVESISPEQGKGLELQAIAACVIGGLSLSGGEGTVLGILFGTALFYTIQNVLFLKGVPAFYIDMLMGSLIIIAVVFNNLTRKD